MMIYIGGRNLYLLYLLPDHINILNTCTNFILTLSLGFIFTFSFCYCYHRAKWLFSKDNRPNFHFITPHGEFIAFIHIKNIILRKWYFYIIWFLVTLRLIIFIIDIYNFLLPVISY